MLLTGADQGGVACLQGLWEGGAGEFSDEEEYDDEEDEDWEETMMLQHQLQQQRLMPPPSRPPQQFFPKQQQQQQHHHPQQQQQHQQMSKEELSNSSDDSSDDDESVFDYYKSNPKHPDITKAIMEGSKAVLEKIIGMSAAKAKAKAKKQKEAKKKKQQKKAAAMATAMRPPQQPVPFIKDAIDAQVVVKQEPLDAGDAELVVRPMPPVHSTSVSSTSIGVYGASSPQRTNMGPPPPPPPKDPSQDYLTYPMGPPLNTQFSPAGSMKGQQQQEGQYKCDICPYTCQRPAVLQRHRLREHGEGEMEFPCPECPNTVFPTHKDLQNHMKSKHKGPTFMCDCHNKVFRSPDSLADHLKKVARDECLTCQTCGKLFVRKDALMNHIQAKHGGGGGNDGSATASQASPTDQEQGEAPHEERRRRGSVPCTICGTTFPTDEDMVNHLKECTINSMTSKLDEAKNYFCDDCQLEFPTEVDLKDHMNTQHKQTYSCDVCSKVYTTEKKLQTHVRKCHPEELE